MLFRSEGLKVTARAADGIVEGLELIEPASWLVAVQWHPEKVAAVEADHQRLFDAFGRACATPRATLSS